MGTIDSNHFYHEYHGHTIADLTTLVKLLPQGRGILYLVGDSTLDNKYWLSAKQAAINGYEHVLRPPRSTPDVAYWLNRLLVERGLGESLCAINTAIEESTLGLRDRGRTLLPQDEFVMQHITERDVLVVSCGGNDIALRPSFCTIASIIPLLATPGAMVDWGMAPGLGHFVSLFRDHTRDVVQRIVSKRKPRVVVVCMLYYLDESQTGGWADRTLSMLGYDKRPETLQRIMRKVFELATSQVRVEGTHVVAVPLFEALDGKTSADYVARVEPSAQGGQKMASLILDRLEPALAQTTSAPAASASGPGGRAAESATADEPAVRAMPSAVHLMREI